MPSERAPRFMAVVVVLLLAACTAQPARPGPEAAPQADQSAPPPRKAVTIGILREPVSLITDLTGGNSSGGGANQVQHIAHDFLTIQTENGSWEPRLAAQPLSVE